MTSQQFIGLEEALRGYKGDEYYKKCVTDAMAGRIRPSENIFIRIGDALEKGTLEDLSLPSPTHLGFLSTDLSKTFNKKAPYESKSVVLSLYLSDDYSRGLAIIGGEVYLLDGNLHQDKMSESAQPILKLVEYQIKDGKPKRTGVWDMQYLGGNMCGQVERRRVYGANILPVKAYKKVTHLSAQHLPERTQ